MRHQLLRNSIASISELEDGEMLYFLAVVLTALSNDRRSYEDMSSDDFIFVIKAVIYYLPPLALEIKNSVIKVRRGSERSCKG